MRPKRTNRRSIPTSDGEWIQHNQEKVIKPVQEIPAPILNKLLNNPKKREEWLKSKKWSDYV